MTKLNRLAAVVVGLTLAAATAANAAELTGTLKKIQETGSITLGYRESSVPFSYLDAEGKPTGYAFLVCKAVADAAQKTLGLEKLDVKYQAVTSANRIPLIQNGTVDIECGSTTNSMVRQKEAAFSVSYFGIQVSAAVWKSSGINTIKDLNGKNVAVTSGTTSVALMKKFEKKNGIKSRRSVLTHSCSMTCCSRGRSPTFPTRRTSRSLTKRFRSSPTAPCSARTIRSSKPSSTRPSPT